MKLIKNVIVLSIVLIAFSCSQNVDESIDEDTLGIIDADVKSEETNLKAKAKFSDLKAGDSKTINRSFENAPALIPHSVEGFFPIKKENNICLTCHMPDKVEESKAIAIPKTHFTNLRPALKEIDGKYYFAKADTLVRMEIEDLNFAYFNCSQCHVPQAEISVDIKNLFTPEFREEFGLEKSTLDKQLEDGL